MAGGVDAGQVDFVILLEGFEHGIEEFEVAVILIAGESFPAGEFAFVVDEPAGRREALRVDDDRLWPGFFEGEARELLHGSAVAVEGEDEGRRFRGGGIGGVDEGFAGDAVDRPLAGGRPLSGLKRSGGEEHD